MYKAAAVALAVAAFAAAPSGAEAKTCPPNLKRGARAERVDDSYGTVLTHPSGLIRLGINREGNFNWNPQGGFNSRQSVSGTDAYGLRYVDADPGHILNPSSPGEEFESTAFGCFCEGWGAGAWDNNSTFLSGGLANEGRGYYFLTELADLVVTPANDASAQNATASVRAGDCLRVVHEYYPSASRYLYQVDVTLTNVCDKPLGTVKYTRAMDWDMEPTPTLETIELNPGNALDLECLQDNGFANLDVTESPLPLLGPECVPKNVITELGSNDHGSYFRFNFHDITNDTPLEPSASLKLRTFYGAAPTRALAVAAIRSVRAEAYSFGRSTSSDGSFGTEGYTAIFAFAEISGTVVTPGNTYNADCETCGSTVVTSSTNVITLSFDSAQPYTATCP